jgi:hypothetical protein
MAINYLNNVDFNRNELQNAQLIKSQVENQPNDAAVGGTPVEGQLYFNTTSDVLKIYGNGSWSEVGGGVITLALNDGTYIDVNSTGTAANPVFTPDLSAVDGTAVAATRFLSKDNTWDVPAFPASDNYDYWVLDADGAGTPANIGSGATADFVGGLKIGTNSTSGGTLNITHDLQTQTDSTSAASPAAGATFTVVDSVTRDTTGHATGLNVKTITLPAATTVGDGQINGATSGLGISGSMSATANQSGDTTFTVASNASIGPTVSTLMHRDTSGYGYVVTPASGSSDTTIATTAWVNQKLTGLLEFKGGFNATSGELDDGSGNDLYTDVVIAVGDYYVVTTAGNFFGNTATPLTVGDSVIVQTAKTAGNAAEADFIVVQSDTDLATLTTVGIGNVGNAGVGTTTTYSNGTATITNTDKGSSQNIFKNVASDSGTAVADNNNDTLSVVGAGSVTTAVVGDVLTITGVNTQGALGDRVVLTGGNTTGGLTTFAYNITSSFAGGTAAYVKCEVLSAAGQTVYADITRSGTTLNVIFAGTVADSDYEALLTYVG